MRMISASVYLQLLGHAPAESTLGKHALDGALDDGLGLGANEFAVVAHAQSARIPGVVRPQPLLVFAAGENDLVGVGDDDVIARVDVRGVAWLMLALKHGGDLGGQTTEHLTLGVDDVPVGFDLARLGEVCLPWHETGPSVLIRSKPGSIARFGKTGSIAPGPASSIGENSWSRRADRSRGSTGGPVGGTIAGVYDPHDSAGAIDESLDSFEPGGPLIQPVVCRGPRPSPALAWLAIVAALLAIVLSAQFERAHPEAPSPVAGDVLFEIQAKVLYAGSQWAGSTGAPVPPEFADLATTPGMAWRISALLAATGRGDLLIEAEAFALIESFDEQVASLSEETRRLHEVVKSAIRAPGTLTEGERALLVSRLDWFGRLLATLDAGSQDPTRVAATREAFRAMWISMAAVGLGLVALGVGCVLLLIKLIVHVNRYGELRIVMHEMRVPAGVYLEAAAIYLALAFVLPLLASLIPGVGQSMGVGIALLTAASVTGVAWPLLRCGSPGEAALELGLHRGRGVWREIGAGIVGYLAVLPLLAVGLVATFVCLFIYMSLAQQYGWDTDVGSGPGAPHPIIEWISGSSVWAKIGVLLLASGFAPFFEEIMFRGALLNGAARTIRLAPGLLVMGFIFAAVHPQGWLAVPALMSLAIGFGFIRLWRRGCLIGPMVAHSIHNGALVFVLLLLAG